MSRILFIVRDLGFGGAQRQLGLLAAGLVARGHEVTVALYRTGDGIAQSIADAGAKVRVLPHKRRWNLPGLVLALRRLKVDFRPDLIYSFLDVPNIVAALANGGSSRVRLIWGVRNAGNAALPQDKWQRLVSWCEVALSGRPDLILCNSHAGRQYVLDRGFPAEKTWVVANGVDYERFRRRQEAVGMLRRSLGLAADVPLLGIVGRLHVMKGHAVFLHAAKLILEQEPGAHFVCIGNDEGGYAASLRKLSANLGVESHVHWCPATNDIYLLYPDLDVLCSASLDEGFSNVLGEAMASEVPVVATEVGDAMRIVGDGGTLVPPGDPAGLAAAVLDLLRLGAEGRAAVGRRGRERLLRLFSSERLIEVSDNIIECLGKTSL